MSKFRVEYYVKPLAVTKITKLGGANWKKTEEQIVSSIADGDSYYVDDGGYTAFLEVEFSPSGFHYLKTVPDGVSLDNLMFLPRKYV